MRRGLLAVVLALALVTAGCNGFVGGGQETPTDDDHRATVAAVRAATDGETCTVVAVHDDRRPPVWRRVSPGAAET